MRLAGAGIEVAGLAAGTAARLAVSRAGGAERFPTQLEVEDALSAESSPQAGEAMRCLKMRQTVSSDNDV